MALTLCFGARALLWCGVAPRLLAFSLSLFNPVLGNPGPVPLPVLAPANGAGGYEAAIAAVEEANIAANNDPEANLATLVGAIERLAEFGPEIAASAEGREALDLSLLNLARTLLLTGDEAQAAEVMDQTIRAAYGRKLPIKRFGPTLVGFHNKRRALLDDQGSASIQVQCQVSCRVVIDAQPATTDSGPLYLGSHRVWIEATDDEVEPARHDIVLDERDVTKVVHFPAERALECEEQPLVEIATPRAEPPAATRILPRWAEITVGVIGLGAAVAGGVMLGLDGKCPGGLDPIADAQQCPRLYEGTVPGLVALGVGSALFVAGTVTLSVDEVRVGNHRGRQATLAWQMRF